MLLTIGQGLGPCKKNNLNTGISSPDDIADLQMWVDAQSFGNITFATGSGDGDPIAAIAEQAGEAAAGLIDENPSDKMIYKSAGVHGKPAIRKSTAVSLMRDENSGSPALYANAVTLVYFFTGIFDGTADSGFICTLVNNFARFSCNSSTDVYWRYQEGSSDLSLTGSYDLSDLTMLAVSITDTGNGLLKINDLSAQSFNPHDSYNLNGSVRIGSTSAAGGGVFHEFYGVMVYDRGLSEQELTQLYNFGVARYG